VEECVEGIGGGIDGFGSWFGLRESVIIIVIGVTSSNARGIKL